MQSFSELSGRNILVTGANGFIGTALVKRLWECGAEVYALVRSGEAFRPARFAMV